MSDHNLAEALRECAVIRAAVSNDDTTRALVRLQRVEMAIKTALAAHSPNPASGTSEQQAGECRACDTPRACQHDGCRRAEQQAGEAVAYRISCPHEPDIGHWYDEEDLTEQGYTCVPLFTHPQQPLSEYQIVRIYEQPELAGTRHASGTEKAIAIARAIERAHGITKDTK